MTLIHRSKPLLQRFRTARRRGLPCFRVVMVAFSIVLVLTGCFRRKGSVSTPPEQTRQFITSSVLPTRRPFSGSAFTSLSTAQSGIDFVHTWVPPERYPYDLETAMFGGGVAIGDFDNDGLSDIYLSRPHGGNRLYRNLGNLLFEDATVEAGVSQEFWGQGASFVDIDNDGDLDLFACAHASPNRLFLNDGRGQFREAAEEFGLAFLGASVMMSFADYDLDGDLDAYLTTNYLNPPPGFKLGRAALTRDGRVVLPKDAVDYRKVLYDADGKPAVVRAAQMDRLYRNDGGQFTDVTTTSGISGTDHGLSAIWWDYDDDKDPDLYVANDFTDADYLYRNNGDGTFSNVIADAMPHTPWFSMGADAADINNDGRLDLIASDMSGSNHYKQKMGMGDMSENLWFLEHPTPRQYMRNAVYLNTGTERFMEVAYLTGMADTDWTWSTNFGDFDEDGYVDLFVTNGMTRDWQNADLRAHVKELGGKTSPRGRRFWVSQPPKADPNIAFRNLGDLQFAHAGERWGLNEALATYGAATSDLDNDGDLDIVTVNFGDQARVYRNNSSSSRRVLVNLKGTASNRFGIGSRIKVRTATGIQVREVTLAHGFASAGEPIVHFGLGNETTIEELSIVWPCSSVQRFQNLDTNREYTIMERQGIKTLTGSSNGPTWFTRASSFTPKKHRERLFDDFQRQPLLPNKLSQRGPGVTTGDIDGDSDIDIFVGGAAGQMGWIYENSDDGQFHVHSTWTTSNDGECEDVGAQFFDADNDGDQDLYVVSGSVEAEPGDVTFRDRLYLNDGLGRFTRATDALPDLRESGSCVAVADFDRDGDVDIFVGGRSIAGRYPETPNSYLLSNQAGSFSEVTDSVANGLRQSGLVTSAIWSDANADGWVDLLVTYEWGPVRFWKNEHGKLVDETHSAGLSHRLGWWTSIAASDIDNDGDLDYAVTNVGLNTKYHATKQQPVHLYYGDYDGSGQKHLVEASFEGDVLFPLRGRSCSANAMPFLRDRFPSFQQFAQADVKQIYSEHHLENATRLQANTLESGILINDGTARFRSSRSHD